MSALEVVVRPSLARIEEPGAGYAKGYWGSGFFIAPGWLLTCAHVVGKGGAAVLRGQAAVGVTWEGDAGTGASSATTGEVVLAKPRPDAPERAGSSWPLPDIALVRVPAATDARCVWLTDREPGIPGPVGLHGWSRQTGDVGIRGGVGEARGWDAGAMVIGDSLPVDGLSGGPVVDQRYGAVVGLNKGRGRDEGVAVPITALYQLLELPGGDILHTVLREHDLYHLGRLSDGRPADPDWPSAQADLPGQRGSAVTPELRIRLHGHLAHLPPPARTGDVMRLVHEVRRLVTGERSPSPILHEPHTWREGTGLLTGLRAPGRGDGRSRVDLEAVLLYAAMVTLHCVRERPAEVAREPLRAFTDWITEQARHHDHWAVREHIGRLLDGLGRSPGSRQAPAPPPTRIDVLVTIGDRLYGDRYPWRVQLLYDGRDVTPVDGDDRGVPLERLHESLREPLARALSQGDHGEHLAAVEVFLPRRLFDLPVDEWQLAPDDPEDDEADLFDERSVPLGLRRTVVIRDLKRNSGVPKPDWRHRWRGTQRGRLSAEPLYADAREDGGTAGGQQRKWAVYGRMLGMAEGRVPVLCGPVGSGDARVALEAALMTGHSVVLWRRDGHDHDECRDFHGQAAGLLESAGRVDALHAPVRELRIRAADLDTARAQGLRGRIAVLLDPPDRPPYGREPMRPPSPAGPDG
ncbi:trypsin-like peptidase domain-containing protein [Streptomyces sp. NPDC050211]|uniref:VMAP-C domain-containing protein n=1 Tax=Streptomyces sp. NPDC050211 TaxID=3154932 RepID=UPI003436E907